MDFIDQDFVDLEIRGAIKSNGNINTFLVVIVHRVPNLSILKEMLV